MVDIEQVTQADRDAAAKFFRDAWHLFWPNDFAKAMEQAKEMQEGYCDDWLLVQSFARHRIAAQSEAATTIERYREALEFYGRANNYRSCTVYMCGHSGAHPVSIDGGNKARQALSHAPEGQPGDGK